MRHLIERYCGRLHASTRAEWFRHDSGSSYEEELRPSDQNGPEEQTKQPRSDGLHSPAYQVRRVRNDRL
jgi:hypothetical protein